MNQFVALPIFFLFAIANGALILRLKKPEQIFLAAAIISAPWKGGYWIGAIMFDLRMSYVFTLLALAFALVNSSRVKNPISKMVTIPLLLLIVWTLIGASQAFDPAIAIGDGAVTMLFNFLYLFTICKIVKTDADITFLLKSVFLGLFYAGILALIQYKSPFFYIGFIDRGFTMFMWWRPRAFFHHPNAYGMYELIILPILFKQAILMLKIKNTKLGYAYLILFLVALFTLYTTQNRGSWVGIAIGLAVTTFIDFFRKGAKKTRKIMIRILIIFTLVSIPALARYGSRIYAHLFEEEGGVSHKAESRATYNIDAWNQVRQHPMFGCGVSNVRYYSSIIFTHNLYLLMLSETGYPGFIFFISYFVGFVWISIKAIRAKNYYVSVVGSGYLTTLIALFIASVPGPDYGITAQVSGQFWIISGIMISLNGVYDRFNRASKLKPKSTMAPAHLNQPLAAAPNRIPAPAMRQGAGTSGLRFSA